MKKLVNSCISKVDRIGMREGRKSCVLSYNMLMRLIFKDSGTKSNKNRI